MQQTRSAVLLSKGSCASLNFEVYTPLCSGPVNSKGRGGDKINNRRPKQSQCWGFPHHRGETNSESPFLYGGAQPKSRLQPTGSDRIKQFLPYVSMSMPLGGSQV